MTPPIDPQALQKVLASLPPEAPDPFAHLAFLTPEGLLQRRIELTHTIRTAEAERTAIDQELTGAYGDAELRQGVRAPGGWVLRSRSRTSWDYAPEVRDAIKGLQGQAQRDGRAQPMVSTYLVATQEST
jgi:hypothetical protein